MAITLSSLTSVADGRAAMERWEQRKAAKKSEKKLSQLAFLSAPAEIEADIAYNFSFVVVGSHARDVCTRACHCKYADLLAESPVKGARALRCYCEVMDAGHWRPPAGQASRAPIARLAFRTLEINEPTPLCSTRQEAASQAIVYVLSIDAVDPTGQSTFPLQLMALQDSMARMRAERKGSLRPMKAIILHSSQPFASRAGLETWALQLSDFEQQHGALWKFGPMHADDDVQFYQTFAEIASSRIRSADQQAGPEDEDGPDGPAAEELFRSPSHHGASPSYNRKTSASSDTSAADYAPRYEAEQSGSEAHESDVEHHNRMSSIMSI